jgi:hypothetical protein
MKLVLNAFIELSSPEFANFIRSLLLLEVLKPADKAQDW